MRIWWETSFAPKYCLRSWPDGCRYWMIGRLRIKWGPWDQ